MLEIKIMEGTPSLICIPDISGFTEYMSEADLKSSKKLIPSLLNQIIYANSIGLKVSEIEGDAVLFYKAGPPPKFRDLLDQCYSFHKDFYAKISEFAKKKDGNEDYENLSERLGLKIIAHYGPIEMTNVGKHLKLIGEDVIVAHRLLKNSIPSHEYILISDTLMDQYDKDTINELIDKQDLLKGSDIYEHIGEFNYYYHIFKP